jgi:RNA polymerase sigma factor (sigma-70 family)
MRTSAPLVTLTTQPMPTPDLDALPDTPAAVARLVANHREFLGFLQSRVGSRALAEDILQDAFVRGIGKISSLRADESAVAWFYRVLRNAVIDHHRRDDVARRRLAAFAAELDEPAAPELHGAVCQCVARLADNLKPEYAEALRRIEVDGLAVKDYASEAGITSNNAAVRVFRAREALRRQVERSCGTCAEHGCLDCNCGAGQCGA